MTLGILLGLAISAFFSELMLSKAPDPIFDRMKRLMSVLKFDPSIGWRGKAGYVGEHYFWHNNTVYDISINKEGFRDIDHPDPENIKRPRVLFFGDSMIFGFGVSTKDLFTKILSDHKKWEIYNLGVMAYGNDQELILLREILAKLRPSHIFFSICTENDKENNSKNYVNARALKQNMATQVFKPFFVSTRDTLELKGIPVSKSAIANYAENSESALLPLTTFMLRNLWEKSKRFDNTTDPTLEILTEVKREVAKYNAKLTFILNNRDTSLEKHLDSIGAHWLSFESLERFRGDIHWNPAGHRELANRIEKLLAPL